jgi:hypothetical protein
LGPTLLSEDGTRRRGVGIPLGKKPRRLNMPKKKNEGRHAGQHGGEVIAFPEKQDLAGKTRQQLLASTAAREFKYRLVVDVKDDATQHEVCSRLEPLWLDERLEYATGRRRGGSTSRTKSTRSKMRSTTRRSIVATSATYRWTGSPGSTTSSA